MRLFKRLLCDESSNIINAEVVLIYIIIMIIIIVIIIGNHIVESTSTN